MRTALLMLLAFTDVRADDNAVGGPAEQPVAKNETIQVNFSNASVVTELQHTVCSVKTEDVVAKAQSSASRILTGVCTSEELTKAFKNMEKSFMERLEQVQENLTNFIQSKFHSGPRKKNVKNSKVSPFRTVDYLFDENIFKNYT